jgi:hypothetical protein
MDVLVGRSGQDFLRGRTLARSRSHHSHPAAKPACSTSGAPAGICTQCIEKAMSAATTLYSVCHVQPAIALQALYGLHEELAGQLESDAPPPAASLLPLTHDVSPFKPRSAH